jgi:hypothetical protein
VRELDAEKMDSDDNAAQGLDPELCPRKFAMKPIMDVETETLAQSWILPPGAKAAGRREARRVAARATARPTGQRRRRR